MRLTKFTDYSLRVLMYAAIHRERRVTIREIAEAYGVSEAHLTKVVHLLGRSGLLDSVRGKGGGLVLSKPAQSINIGAVARLTEGPPMLAECFDRLQNQCAITASCRLRTALNGAAGAFYAVLDQYTLDDITANRKVLARILKLPGPERPRRAA